MTKFLTLLLLLTLWACQSESRNPLKAVAIKTATGDIVKTTIVYTPEEMERGLSGTKSENFDEDQGMIFFYLADDEKHFWMPDTYFDLDLFYLDQNLKVNDIIRKLPHYIGRSNPDLIPRARGVWARYVLEMKASSSISAKIKIGDTLEWKSDLTLEQTASKIGEDLAKIK